MYDNTLQKEGALTPAGEAPIERLLISIQSASDNINGLIETLQKKLDPCLSTVNEPDDGKRPVNKLLPGSSNLSQQLRNLLNSLDSSQKRLGYLIDRIEL
jgi:hypothetical protein